MSNPKPPPPNVLEHLCGRGAYTLKRNPNQPARLLIHRNDAYFAEVDANQDRFQYTGGGGICDAIRCAEEIVNALAVYESTIEDMMP